MTEPEKSERTEGRRRKSRAPDWALRSPRDFLDQIQLTNEVLDLSVRGTGMITAMPKAIAALAKADGAEGSRQFEGEQKRARDMAELAQREISSGFSILHSQAAVSLWGGLESMVQDLVRDWICNRPDILSREPWTNLKVRIGEYEALDKEQRAAYLVELADQSVGGPLKHGVGRFEELLRTIGLSGAVSEDVRKVLFELQQARNVLVHRRGVADRRFCDACPWMKLKPGQRVLITHKNYADYVTAAYKYTTELILRTGESFGVPNMREISIHSAGAKEKSV